MSSTPFRWTNKHHQQSRCHLLRNILYPVIFTKLSFHLVVKFATTFSPINTLSCPKLLTTTQYIIIPLQNQLALVLQGLTIHWRIFFCVLQSFSDINGYQIKLMGGTTVRKWGEPRKTNPHTIRITSFMFCLCTSVTISKRLTTYVVLYVVTLRATLLTDDENQLSKWPLYSK